MKRRLQRWRAAAIVLGVGLVGCVDAEGGSDGGLPAGAEPQPSDAAPEAATAADGPGAGDGGQPDRGCGDPAPSCASLDFGALNYDDASGLLALGVDPAVLRRIAGGTVDAIFSPTGDCDFAESTWLPTEIVEPAQLLVDTMAARSGRDFVPCEPVVVHLTEACGRQTTFALAVEYHAEGPWLAARCPGLADAGACVGACPDAGDDAAGE